MLLLPFSEYGAGMIQFQGIHSFTKEVQAKAVIHATDKTFSMYQGKLYNDVQDDI